MQIKQHIIKDNGDNLYFEFIQSEHWCQNQFQVTQQITMKGTYENRYDNYCYTFSYWLRN